MRSVKKTSRTAHQAPKSTTLPIDSDSVIYRGSNCFYCLEKLMTDTRGTIRIHEGGTPYGKCLQSIKGGTSHVPFDVACEAPVKGVDHLSTAHYPVKEPLIPDSVFLGAQAFNERHRAILEDPANDPTLRENWKYYPAADGNKKRMVYKPFKGLK